MEDGPAPDAEKKEALTPKRFELQTPREFRDDFVASAAQAKKQIGLETMQFEICDDTLPLFNTLLGVNRYNHHVPDMRFHYDRVARQHIRVGESAGRAIGGRLIRTKGDKEAVRKAHDQREQIIDRLELVGISRPRGHLLDPFDPHIIAARLVSGGAVPPTHDDRSRMRHNHVKLGLVDDTAWLLTMNLRALDFDISNFAMKITDPHWVGVMREVFNMEEDPSIVKDRVFKNDDDPDTEVLFDAGVKNQSAIYERAVQMAASLGPGDEFTFIGQWPPASFKFDGLLSVYGEFLKTLDARSHNGTRGLFLMNTKDHLHPAGLHTSHALQRHVEKRYSNNANTVAENLPRDTHVKALLIKRASGDTETLFGTHNLSKFTVRNGTRELAMWSRDPSVTGQIDTYLQELRAETPPGTAIKTGSL